MTEQIYESRSIKNLTKTQFNQVLNLKSKMIEISNGSVAYNLMYYMYVKRLKTNYAAMNKILNLK